MVYHFFFALDGRDAQGVKKIPNSLIRKSRPNDYIFDVPLLQIRKWAQVHPLFANNVNYLLNHAALRLRESRGIAKRTFDTLNFNGKTKTMTNFIGKNHSKKLWFPCSYLPIVHTSSIRHFNSTVFFVAIKHQSRQNDFTFHVSLLERLSSNAFCNQILPPLDVPMSLRFRQNLM